MTLAPPVSLNRTLAIERLDYNTPGGKDRVMGRLLLNRLGRAGFHLDAVQGFRFGAAREYLGAGGELHSPGPSESDQ